MRKFILGIITFVTTFSASSQSIAERVMRVVGHPGSPFTLAGQLAARRFSIAPCAS